MSCPSINIQSMSQEKRVMAEKSKSEGSSSKNKGANKSPDVRCQVGKQFEIDVINFLRKNNLISQQQNNSLSKVTYQVEEAQLNNLQLTNQYDKQLVPLNTSTLEMLVLNNHEKLEVEYDIFPHIRNDKSYGEVIQMFKYHQKSSPINIYENIFGGHIDKQDSKKIIYAGEVKRNFFNPSEIMKNFPFPHKTPMSGDQKISFYRTASIVRKICLVRRQEIEIVNETLNQVQRKFIQKNMRLSQLNKKQYITQASEAITNMQEYPICFFLIIYAGREMDDTKFLEKFSENQKKFLRKHCEHYTVTINLVVIVNENESLSYQMKAIKLEMTEVMRKEMSKMEKKIDQKIDAINTQMKQIKNMLDKIMKNTTKQ